MIFIESFPPNISAPATFVITVGMSSIYSFTVTTESTNLNVTSFVNDESYNNITRNGDTFTLTYNTFDRNEEINLTIIATTEQDARSMVVPRVQLCGCMNNGNCTVDGVPNIESPFVVLNCECPAGILWFPHMSM